MKSGTLGIFWKVGRRRQGRGSTWIAGVEKKGLIALVVCFLFADSIYGQARLPVIPLYVKDKTIRVEVARTEEEQAKGLMGRKFLGRDEGMLFVYERDVHHGFWMKDTLIPLSIAFIDQAGRIVAIEDMEPLTLDVHQPPQAYRYALEMNRGWFEAHKVHVGDFIRFSK